MSFIDLTPARSAAPIMKMAFEQAILRHKEDIETIDNFIGDNDLPYVVESALYVGIDSLQKAIDDITETLKDPWFADE